MFCPNLFHAVKILLDGGLDNGELVRPENSKTDRSTIQKRKTNENSEEYAKIYNKGLWVQTWIER